MRTYYELQDCTGTSIAFTPWARVANDWMKANDRCIVRTHRSPGGRKEVVTQHIADSHVRR